MSNKIPVYDLVGGTLRSIAQSLPIAGSFANAWSELEAHQHKKRIDELLGMLSDLIKKNGDRLAAIEKYVQGSDEFVSLLEKTVRKSLGEADVEKRQAYAVVLFNAISDGGALPYDEKVDTIDALDSLTTTDIRILRLFEKAVRMRVADVLPNSVNPFATPDQEAHRLGAVVRSLSKLEARGLIGESQRGEGVFSWTGDPNHWVNRWRSKTFEVLPAGANLLRVLAARI